MRVALFLLTISLYEVSAFLTPFRGTNVVTNRQRHTRPSELYMGLNAKQMMKNKQGGKKAKGPGGPKKDSGAPKGKGGHGGYTCNGRKKCTESARWDVYHS